MQEEQHAYLSPSSILDMRASDDYIPIISKIVEKLYATRAKRGVSPIETLRLLIPDVEQAFPTHHESRNAVLQIKSIDPQGLATVIIKEFGLEITRKINLLTVIDISSTYTEIFHRK